MESVEIINKGVKNSEEKVLSIEEIEKLLSEIIKGSETIIWN